MNTLELKGGMIELIGQVKNKELLQHLYEIISEVLADTAEDNITLSTEQEMRLDEDVNASNDPKNHIDHKVAVKKISK